MVRWMDTIDVRQNVDFKNLAEKINELKAMRRQRRITIKNTLIIKIEVLYVERSTKRLRKQSMEAQANYLNRLKTQRRAHKELKNSLSTSAKRGCKERKAKVPCIWAYLGKLKHNSILEHLHSSFRQERLLNEKMLYLEAHDAELMAVEDALKTLSE